MNVEFGSCLDAVRQQLESVQKLQDPSSEAARSLARSAQILARLATMANARTDRLQAVFAAWQDALPVGASWSDDPALLTALQRHVGVGNGEKALQDIVARLMRNPDTAAQELLRKITRFELAQLRGFEDALQQASAAGNTAASAAADGLSPQQVLNLQQYLRDRYTDEPDLRVTTTTLISGGFSKQTIFVSLTGVRQLPDVLVLRIDKAVKVLGTSVEDEFPVIVAMHKSGVRVPTPFFLESNADIVGGAFMALARLPGKVIGDPFDVFEPSREFGFSLATQLAKLHAVPEALAGERIYGAKLSVMERVSSDIAACEESWRSFDQPSITLETAYGWLKQNIHLADGPRSIVHRDIGCHNLLVENNQISGILDWETAAIGTPAQDLGCAYPTAIQLMPWPEFVDAYVAAGGARPSPEAIAFYRIWRDTWLLWTLSQARAALQGGLAGDLTMAFIVTNFSHRLTLRLHEQLHQVLAA